MTPTAPPGSAVLRLRVLVPTEVVLDVLTTAVLLEGLEGSRGLLPRHRDIVSVLVPGLLTYRQADGEHHLAVDGGLLVKQGQEVTIATPRAVVSAELSGLVRAVDEEFRSLRDQERRARAAAERMEADVVRRFIQLEHP